MPVIGLAPTDNVLQRAAANGVAGAVLPGAAAGLVATSARGFGKAVTPGVVAGRAAGLGAIASVAATVQAHAIRRLDGPALVGATALTGAAVLPLATLVAAPSRVGGGSAAVLAGAGMAIGAGAALGATLLTKDGA